MPYRYFGRATRDFGRPLWEILMNLKNFGKGRLVTRSLHLRECPTIPSFYKIVSVHPHILEYPDRFNGNIFVEEVFRGRKRSSIIDIGKDSDKSDFQLIQKENEAVVYKKVEEFLADPKNHDPIVRPKTTPLPPVWRLVIARERNISPDQVPEIPIAYEDIDTELQHPTRFPKDGEEPHYRLGPGHFTPVHQEFYEHVIWNREAAREKYCQGPPPEPDHIYLRDKLPPLDIKKKADSSQSSATLSR